MGRPVERSRPGGDAAGDLGQTGRRDRPVQESGRHSIGRGERLKCAGVRRCLQISTAALGMVSPMATSFAVILYGPAAPTR
jgi:hypothetical protein